MSFFVDRRIRWYIIEHLNEILSLSLSTFLSCFHFSIHLLRQRTLQASRDVMFDSQNEVTGTFSSLLFSLSCGFLLYDYPVYVLFNVAASLFLTTVFL
jgi:hypothetical protein